MHPTAVLSRKKTSTKERVRQKRPLEQVDGNHQQGDINTDYHKRLKERLSRYESDEEEDSSNDGPSEDHQERNGIFDTVTSNVTLERIHSLAGGLTQEKSLSSQQGGSQGVRTVLKLWQKEGPADLTTGGKTKEGVVGGAEFGREKLPPEAGSQGGVGKVLRDWQKDGSNDNENGIYTLMKTLEKVGNNVQSQDWQELPSPGRNKETTYRQMETNSIREIEPEPATLISPDIYMSCDSRKTAELSDETETAETETAETKVEDNLTPQIDPSVYYSMPSQEPTFQQPEAKQSSPSLKKEHPSTVHDNTQRSFDLASLGSVPVSDSQYFQHTLSQNCVQHTLSQNCDLLIEAHQRLTKREREDEKKTTANDQESKKQMPYPSSGGHLPLSEVKSKLPGPLTPSFDARKESPKFSPPSIFSVKPNPQSIFSVKPRTITSARYKETQPRQEENYNVNFLRKTKSQKIFEHQHTQDIAKRAAFLVEQMKKNKAIEKQFLLQMAQRRENPRAGPATLPKPGSVINLGFYWGQYPPLEKILRNHMEEYYELSVNKCQSRAQQEFNNRLVSFVELEAKTYGWTFNKDHFGAKKIRDRVRCFFKTHIQNAKKRMNTMIHNPLKKANAKALANHLDLIEKHYDDATNREKMRCTGTVDSQVVSDPTDVGDAKDAAQLVSNHRQ
jgi:hypothetical protein